MTPGLTQCLHIFAWRAADKTHTSHTDGHDTNVATYHGAGVWRDHEYSSGLRPGAFSLSLSIVPISHHAHIARLHGQNRRMMADQVTNSGPESSVEFSNADVSGIGVSALYTTRSPNTLQDSADIWTGRGWVCRDKRACNTASLVQLLASIQPHHR